MGDWGEHRPAGCGGCYLVARPAPAPSQCAAGLLCVLYTVLYTVLYIVVHIVVHRA